MSYLVDTNVLLRSVQKTHPMQLDASRAIDLLLHHGGCPTSGNRQASL